MKGTSLALTCGAQYEAAGTTSNKQLFKAWFSYAADAPVTWPPVYCLGYCSDMRTEVADNTGHPSLYRRHACEVDSRSTSQACCR